MDSELGRLVRTLKDRCGECNHPMQLRARKNILLVRGIENTEEEEYKICSNCGLEIEIPLKDRKKRVEYFDKTAYVKPVENDRRDNGKYSKRSTVNKGYGKSDGKSSGKNSR